MTEEELEAKIREIEQELAKEFDQSKRAKLLQQSVDFQKELTRRRAGVNAGNSPLAGVRAGGQPSELGERLSGYFDEGSKQVNQLKNNIADKLKKEAVKAAAKAIWAGIRSGFLAIIAYLGWPIAILIIILLLVLGIAVGYYRVGLPGPRIEGGDAGKFATVADKGWLKDFLVKANDVDVKTRSAAEIKTQLTNVLNDIDQELKKPENASLAGADEAIKTIASLNNRLATLDTNNGKSKSEAAKIKADLVALLESLSPCTRLIRLAKENKIITPDAVTGKYDAKLELEELESTGKITHSSADVSGDNSQVSLDPRVCSILVTMADNISSIGVRNIPLSLFTKNHRKMTSNGKRQSDHWTGKAVDIDIKTTDEGGKIGKWIVENKDTLKKAGIFPKQLILPKAYSQWAVNKWKNDPGFYAAGHENHVHIGY